MCEIDIDDCATEPCQRGQCIDQVNGFICNCYPGSEGVLCDVSEERTEYWKLFLLLDSN